MKIGSSKKYSTGMNLEFSVKRKSKLWVDLSSGDVNILEKETSGMKSEFPFVTIFSILLESSKVCKTFRSKFSSIPIPGAEVTLDGSDLKTQAATEKEQLITQIKEMLEATSRRSLLEAKKDETEFLESTLNRVPMPIYIG